MPKPSETLDGYLTKMVQAAVPGGMVFKIKEEGKEYFVLREEGKKDLGLGDKFLHAKSAIVALKEATKKVEERQEQ